MRDDDLLDPEKVSKFWDKIYKMADKEFGLDCDSDSRVQIIVVDRSRRYGIQFRQIAYEHKASSLKELEEIMDSTMSNLKLAMENFQSFLRSREYEEKRIKAEEQAKVNP